MTVVTRWLKAGGRNVPLLAGPGALEVLPQALADAGFEGRLFVVADQHAMQLHEARLRAVLPEAALLCISGAEADKTLDQVSKIWDWLVDRGAQRRDALVGFGGGVVCDLVGFAAACYLRGIGLVNAPTTLLAQVDAAIGGKTGINHPRGKNLIGAFYHPRFVLADPATLLTLPARERTEGWAEVVKYGIILDATLFAQLEEYADELRDFSHPPAQLLCQIIARCIALKAAVIEEDEREQARRAILNYGHTVAHALENLAGYGVFLHGEAVSLGMVAAAAIAQQAGMCDSDLVTLQNALLQALGWPVAYEGQVRAADILAAIQLDKKVANKQVRWVMP